MVHDHIHDNQKKGHDKLTLAIAVNVMLTLAQVVGGLLSGSLSLIADALHNLSDAASLGIALFARIIGNKPADKVKTFGYKRAEVIGALINLTTLILMGIYLIYQALWRFVVPNEISGWLVVMVAIFALIVDVVTAVLTYTLSKGSLNMKAAFLHNVSDAMASVGVIVAGSLILLYQWYWVDALMTLLIAGYVLWQGFAMLPKVIHLLMEGMPENLSLDDIVGAMEATPNVLSVHHVHVWQLDEEKNALEAHIVIDTTNLNELENIKQTLKLLLAQRFKISHSTLEIETPLSLCGGDTYKH
jgi:cobalt-zinc-cadmium efflux system protein